MERDGERGVTGWPDNRKRGQVLINNKIGRPDGNTAQCCNVCVLDNVLRSLCVMPL